MALAIQLAKQGHFTTSPNPRVGCVIVNNGEIVGTGFHKKAGTPHAEVYALREAGDKARGATAYVTLEPCSHFGRTPPCAQALIDHGLAKVIAANVDPNPQVAGRGLKMLAEAGIDAAYGLLADEAEQLNQGFLKLMRTQMPYVRCKLAASLDGQTAMASGESQWITSPEARRDVQRLRAQSCAVLTGADSVLMDGAKMTVRHQELGSLANSYPAESLRQPVRVVIDGQQRLTPDLPMFQPLHAKLPHPIILLRTKVENEQTWPHFVSQVAIATDNGKINLAAALSYLGSLGLNDILLESGERLAGAFIEQDLVDELILYQAPKLMGAGGKGLCAMPSITTLGQAKTLTINDVTMVGADMKITAQFAGK
ncbi:bifunctional diaminohydroxyphosphoribosylaminopyrimidine deaminase/5-amino-6-(5-phosphoribosylamino)uracil reductase RibD [Thalassotalea euphylliae]|uniref:Riboflavin biosynthesis protein RibD n=1 Tax=Thalassotalea euphylliae TaxID=1655234 RepID=A0A3E0TWD0_9GAMM|nr:bifunctional diaminohydroxyphosphoribosylaminopyrimidine deaminase/5-amino-6-(5-phosphoribosylamino)uracil reductase RibD [Thalassotalea euphylliae]